MNYVRLEKLSENYMLRQNQKHSAFTKGVSKDCTGENGTGVTKRLGTALLYRPGLTVGDAMTEPVSPIAVSMSILR